jgi:hypothetical protein
MTFFEELGSLVGRLWKENNLDARAFPVAAMKALAELPPADNISFREAVFLGLSDPLPVQNDLSSEFGQPPLTVYSAEEFRIELLFWLQAQPSIHQHGFSGAFHVMHGNTLHVGWKFRQRERITPALLLGDVNINHVELLRQGDSRPIIAGDSFIHTTYHLQQPTVSVVVRTIRERDFLPQYTYLPPSIAFDPDARRPSMVRRNQLLSMLLKLGRPDECFDAMQSLLATSDAFGTFDHLLWANAAVRDANMRHEIVATARVKHAYLVQEMLPALAFLRRQLRLEEIRNRVNDPDLQFFLGVLINVPDLKLAMSILQEQYPTSDPVEVAVDFMDRLSMLGLLGFRLNDSLRFMLSCVLRGTSDPVEVEGLFVKRYGIKAVSTQQESIHRLAQELSKFWMLEPYFEPSSRENTRGIESTAELLFETARPA